MLSQSPPKNLKPYFQVLEEIRNDDNGRLDWQEFFKNDHPVEIDVGCGRGLFLFHAGQARPDRNFLGIELDYKEARRGATRIQKLGLNNVRVIGGDVFVAFSKMIATHSVDAIHVYFPDPWWKRRHRQRRVFNDRFADLAAQLLKPGAMLHSWTDVEEYFGVISGLMDHHEHFIRQATPDERAPSDDMDYQTSYERKKRKLGLPIYRGLWQRRMI